MKSNQDWTTDALCRQADPDLFYPEDETWSGPAKRVCSACPVMAQCLAYALVGGEPFGVWGGLNTDERTLVRAALSAVPLGRDGAELAGGRQLQAVQGGAA